MGARGFSNVLDALHCDANLDVCGVSTHQTLRIAKRWVVCIYFTTRYQSGGSDVVRGPIVTQFIEVGHVGGAVRRVFLL